MRHPTNRLLLIVLTATLWLPSLHGAQAQPATDLALVTIGQLATLNGQALACESVGPASRAKKLMLVHAPKTGRFGDVFDDGTHQAFLQQIQIACPPASDFNQRLDELERRLQQVLPSAQPTPTKPTPAQ